MTIASEWREAIDAMNLRRGLVRLGIGVAVLWFVFWTFAYVLHPPSTLNPDPGFTTRVTAPGVVVPCLLAILVLGAWVWIGFRSGERTS